MLKGFRKLGEASLKPTSAIRFKFNEEGWDLIVGRRIRLGCSFEKLGGD